MPGRSRDLAGHPQDGTAFMACETADPVLLQSPEPLWLKEFGTECCKASAEGSFRSGRVVASADAADPLCFPGIKRGRVSRKAPTFRPLSGHRPGAPSLQSHRCPRHATSMAADQRLCAVVRALPALPRNAILLSALAGCCACCRLGGLERRLRPVSVPGPVLPAHTPCPVLGDPAGLAAIAAWRAGAVPAARRAKRGAFLAAGPRCAAYRPCRRAARSGPPQTGAGACTGGGMVSGRGRGLRRGWRSWHRGWVPRR
jgi:hypothetical protein